MMMKRFVSFVWMSCVALLLTAQHLPNLQFRHLQVKDNLSHYSVMALYQDAQGLIWIGTRNGVSVFDGQELHTFRHQPDDPNSIMSNYVRGITSNGADRIYFLTLRGICYFDVQRECFITVTEEQMTAFCYNQRLFMASGRTLFTVEDEDVTTLCALPDEGAHVISLAAHGDSLLIGTQEHGLYLYEQGMKKLTHLLPERCVGHLFRDSKGSWWVGTWDNGLYRLTANQITNYRHRDGDPHSLCSNFIRSCCEDVDGNLWVGTFRGLSKLPKGDDEFVNFPSIPAASSAVDASVWSLLCDTQGTIWVGTYFGGVSYFNPHLNFYHSYPVATANREGLSFPVVGSMVEDDERRLWICTDGGGLNCLDLNTGQFTHYLHSDAPHSLSHNNVKCLYFDRKRQMLWIGTHLGGLNSLDLRTQRFTRYIYKVNGKSKELANIVCDIVPHDDELLLATHDGVYSFNVEQERFIPLFQGAREEERIALALDLQFDLNGRLWIAGAQQGAYCYDFGSHQLKLYSHHAEQPSSLSSNGVNSIELDEKGRLWFCLAETGLDLYRPEHDDFLHFDEAHNGLLSNCVYGACALSSKQLLVITDKGFSCLDLTKGAFRNVDVRSGLPLSAINQKALYKTSDHQIFIGGIDGLVSFTADDLNHIHTSCRLFPYKLFVNDREVKVGDDTGLLNQTLAQTHRITLSAEHTMFSILYALTDYMPQSQPELRYKLEHFQEGWNTLRGGRMITYTNLSPGHYTLLVKLDGPQGETIPVSRLEIEVLPPFYRSTVAWIGYILLFALLLLVGVRAWKKRIRLQAELKYERKHLADVELLNQHKLRFFTNISHEFRTPLTLIIGQMEMLLQVRSFTPSVYNKILSIYKSGLQLQGLIGELLDFRKQEQGHMHIKVSEQNIVDFLYENFLLFREYAAKKQIDFKFNKSNDTIAVWFDAKQLQKVVNNLLSNAFKYTQERGEIALSVRKGNGEVIVEVSDNGCGIDENDQEHIFDRFYQAEHNHLGNGTGIGVGLALTKGIVELHHGHIQLFSKPGEGSIFSFSIPLGREAFSADEVATHRPEEMVINRPAQPDFEPMNEEVQVMKRAEEEQGRSVLIVEDEVELRGMLSDIFVPYYRVTTAASGEEALQRIKEDLPDLVLTDVMMPGMSGIELCKQLKKGVTTSHIPVMILTARTAIECRLEGLQTGADDYITKPFDVNILLARCKNLINNRILLQEKYSKQPQQVEPVIATSPADKEFIDQAMRILQEHLGDSGFSVDLFAREMGVARTKLYAKIKSISGQTPNELLMQVRLKRAACLLRYNPELNVSQIAESVGFCSSRYFSRCFKEYYQASPQSYRKGESAEEELDEGVEHTT